MNIKKKTFILVIIATFIIGVGVTFGAVAIRDIANIGDTKISRSEYKNLNEIKERYAKAEEIRKKIKGSYYKDISDKELDLGIYRGMVKGLDDLYSNYMTAKEYAEWMNSTLGQFEGIGILFKKDDKGNFVILKVNSGSPAEKGGLKAGDFVRKVDGKTYEDVDLIGSAMRGKAGTKVDITYERENQQNTVTLVRAKLTEQTVTSEVRDGDIGYIKISAFEEATARDFKTALKDLEAKNVVGLIIDLRDNGGGLVKTGAEIVDSLIGKGTITYLQDRNGKKEYIYSNGQMTKLPYVLIVNGNTASTSEIVSAAVKDNGPGKIVGTTTYGKGVVQITDKLSDGSALKLTVYQYFSPKGNAINGKGVEPDYKVEGEDAQIQKATEVLKSLM